MGRPKLLSLQQQASFFLSSELCTDKTVVPAKIGLLSEARRIVKKGSTTSSPEGQGLSVLDFPGFLKTVITCLGHDNVVQNRKSEYLSCVRQLIVHAHVSFTGIAIS